MRLQHHLGPTGSDLLAGGAVLLPAVLGSARSNTGSLRTSLVNAARRLHPGISDTAAVGLAEEAADMLAAYLTDVGELRPGPTDRLHNWVTGRNAGTVALAMRCAAGWYRGELAREVAA